MPFPEENGKGKILNSENVDLHVVVHFWRSLYSHNFIVTKCRNSKKDFEEKIKVALNTDWGN